jgi:hypothetical protein
VYSRYCSSSTTVSISTSFYEYSRFAELEGRDIVLDLHGMRVDEAVRVTLDALAIADTG